VKDGWGRVALGGFAAVLTVAAGLVAAGVAPPLLIALVVPGIASIAGVVWLSRRYTVGLAPDTRRRILWLALVVYGVHLAISMAIDSSVAVKSALAPDSLSYHELATQIVTAWRNGYPIPGGLGVGKEGFVLGLAALYFIFGPYPAAGLAVTAACSAGLIPVTYDTTRRLFGSRAARVGAALVAVLPGFVIWSAQLLREAPIVFLLAVLANAVVRLNERLSVAAVGTLGASLVVLFTLRANVALVALSGVAIGLALGSRRPVLGVVLAVVAVAGVVGVALTLKVGSTGLSAAAGSANLQQLEFYRKALGSGAGSATNADVDISTPSGALGFLPTAVVSFLFGPFPWQVRNLFQWFGVLDALSVWILVPPLVRGVRRGVRAVGRGLFALVAPAALLLGTLGLLISNFGMIVRERPQVLVLLVPLVAGGWANRQGRPEPVIDAMRRRSTAPTDAGQLAAS
jgi:hypothetical protein